MSNFDFFHHTHENKQDTLNRKKEGGLIRHEIHFAMTAELRIRTLVRWSRSRARRSGGVDLQSYWSSLVVGVD